ncbi:hypothetical protein ACNKHV_14145 [Shigella flexneri]
MSGNARLWSRLMTTTDRLIVLRTRSASCNGVSSASVGRVTNANSQTILRQFTYFHLHAVHHFLPQHFAVQVHRNAHNEQRQERIALFARSAAKWRKVAVYRQFFHRHHLGQFGHFITCFFQQLPCCFAALGLLTEMPHVVRSTSAPGGAVLASLTVAQNCILLAGKRDFIEIQRIAVNLIAGGSRFQSKAVSLSPGISRYNWRSTVTGMFFVEPFLPVRASGPAHFAAIIRHQRMSGTP